MLKKPKQKQKRTENFEKIKISIIILLLALLVLVACTAEKEKITGSITKDSINIDETSEAPEVYFCPTSNCSKQLENKITSAKLSIYCAFYDINLKNIIEILSSKSKTIDVKLVMDISNYKNQVVGNGVRFDNNNQLMHNKFCVIDGLTVVTGSLNPTYNDNERNNNNLIIIYSKTLAKNYEDEFNELWNGEFGKGKRVVNSEFRINNIKIENYFCPEDCKKLLNPIVKDDALSKILDLIRKANNSVHLASFTFTNEDIANELIRAQTKGVNVTILIEKKQRSVMNSQYERLKSFGLNIKVDGNKYNMHHKFIVIDGKILVTGSPNFTFSGFNNNDENLIIIYDEEIANKFRIEFNILYDEVS